MATNVVDFTDEHRYFAEASGATAINIRNCRLGLAKQFISGARTTVVPRCCDAHVFVPCLLCSSMERDWLLRPHHVTVRK